MKTIILTNNPKVSEELSSRENVEYIAAEQTDILLRVRDMIHLGAKLVTHPMPGRIRPHETPYKTVMLEVPDAPSQVDFESLMIIEDAISETGKHLENTYQLKYVDEFLPDLQFIDLTLLKEALSEYRR